MPRLPSGYLKRRDGKWRSVKLFDLALLLFYLKQAADDKAIGHEDTHETVDSIEKKLNKEIWVEPRIVEACLWAANLMVEQGKWWHPRGFTFDDWLKQILGRDRFHKIFNCIELHEGQDNG